MRSFVACTFVLITLTMMASQAVEQPDHARPAGLPTDANVIAYGNRAEGALLAQLRDANPIVEAYFQKFVPAPTIGYKFEKDYYYLGRLNGKELMIEDLLSYQRTAADHKSNRQALDGILDVMVPDWKQLGPDRYGYKFVKLTFLGALRCAVYDVRPLNPEEGGFTGRIYLEDRSWNIVRFTGVNSHADAMLAALRGENSKFHIDSWRLNAAKNHWTTALTYVEEVAPLGAPEGPLVRGQIRFWGYDQPSVQPREENGTVALNGSSTTDESRRQALSPEENERRFKKQAQDNVLDRLTQARLLGPSGRVEKMLDQVVTNLLASNKLFLGEPVQCRILLTTRLEIFTVYNTIVVSRGLIDVLPEESPIAFLLAHQLAHNILGHRRIDTKLAFPNLLQINDAELLAKLRFQHSAEEETAADAKAMEIIDLSPYNKAMPLAGTVMQALRYYGESLSNLIQPHFGEHVADVQHGVGNHPDTRLASVFNPELPDQVAGLPLGSKLTVNPWDGSVEYFQAERSPFLAPSERADYAIRPFMPFLSYFPDSASVPEPVNASAPRRSHGVGATSTQPKSVAKKGAL